MPGEADMDRARGGHADGPGAMAPTGRGAAPAFAIVIPMRDEAGAAGALLEGCIAAAAPLGAFEICVTDDGSRDGTGAVLSAVQRAHPGIAITVLTHARSAGQSAAVQSAVRVARAPLVCTLDGDGQNPPEEIPRLLAPLLAPDAPAALGLVAGQRLKRNDPWSRRMASRIANAIRRGMLKDGTVDSGCGLKAFRRDAFLGLPQFDHMHRFLPALFARDGWQVALIEVSHRPRDAGRSKYSNLRRALAGIPDLLGVAWLVMRRRRILPAEIEVHAQPGAVE